MPEPTSEGREVMSPPVCPKDRRLTLTVGENTSRYVPEDAYDALLDAYYGLRRTVALAHTHLVFDGEGARESALDRIQQGTGLTFEDARAMQSILLSVRDGSLTAGVAS